MDPTRRSRRGRSGGLDVPAGLDVQRREPYDRLGRRIELGPVDLELRDRLPADQLLALGPVLVDATPQVVLAAGQGHARHRALDSRAAWLEHCLSTRVDQEDRGGGALG